MTSSTPTLPPIPGGPYDIEFFFDPGCPFAWQTSRWVHRVKELRGISVGWRFISLKMINEGNDVPPEMLRAQERGLAYHRICAAAREAHGNDAVERLYTAYGRRLWHGTPDLPVLERMAANAEAIDVDEILSEVGLPGDLAAAADDPRWDEVLRAESDEAFRRTGPDVGTPIITYDPPTGNSLFGPVISSVPDDEDAVRLYDALRTMVDLETFSELKRSKRPPLDLPVFAA